MAEVTFHYTVTVEDDQIVQDEEGRWRLKDDDAKEAAYDFLMDGISDRSDNWFPRYEVLCLAEFMAGQVCELERGHEGSHR